MTPTLTENKRIEISNATALLRYSLGLTKDELSSLIKWLDVIIKGHQIEVRNLYTEINDGWTPYHDTAFSYDDLLKYINSNRIRIASAYTPFDDNDAALILKTVKRGTKLNKIKDSKKHDGISYTYSGVTTVGASCNKLHVILDRYDEHSTHPDEKVNDIVYSLESMFDLFRFENGLPFGKLIGTEQL